MHRLSLRLQVAVLSLTLAALVVLGPAVLFDRQLQDQDVQAVGQVAEARADAVSLLFARAVQELRADAEYAVLLAETSGDERALLAEPSLWEDVLARHLLAQAENHPELRQLRLLDGTTGDERLRIERAKADDAPLLVPDSGLQPKGDRAYFRDALAARGAAIVTAVDLNREHHVIEQPQRPVIRVARQLSGGRADVVVINYDAGSLLERARASMPPGWELYVADERGRVLLHPDATQEFAWEYGPSPTLAETTPDLRALLEQPTPAMLLSPSRVSARREVPLGSDSSGRHVLDIVISAPPALMLARVHKGRASAAWLFAAALVASLVMIYALASYITRPLRTVASAAAMTRDATELVRLQDSELPPDLRVIAQALSASHDQLGARKSELVAALRERERIEAELNSVPPGVLVIRVDGLITHATPHAAELFGRRPDELIGTNVDELLPVALRAAHPKQRQHFVASAAHDGVRPPLAVRALRADGSEFLARVALRRVTVAGEAKILAAIEDVTEAVARDDAWRQLQRLTSLGRLAGHLAHDYNNALTGIIGALHYLELASGDIDAEAVQDLKEATEHAKTLTRQLLAISGKGAMKREPIAVDTVFTELMAALEREALPRLTVTTEAVAHGLELHVDAPMVSQLAVNLAALIAYHVRTEGFERVVLTVQTSPERPEWLTLCVRLTDGQPRQLSDSPPATLDLPMAAVHGVAYAHGGTSTLDELRDATRELRVELPNAASATAPPSPLLPRRVSRANTVLVIDDEPVVRKVATRALTRLGYQVLTADDGDVGLELVYEHHPHLLLVLCDLTMPRVPGAQVYAAVRQLDAELPIILSSGFTATDSPSEDLAADPNGYFLPKPYSIDELCAVMVRATGSAR